MCLSLCHDYRLTARSKGTPFSNVAVNLLQKSTWANVNYSLLWHSTWQVASNGWLGFQTLHLPNWSIHWMWRRSPSTRKCTKRANLLYYFFVVLSRHSLWSWLLRRILPVESSYIRYVYFSLSEWCTNKLLSNSCNFNIPGTPPLGKLPTTEFLTHR